MKNKKVPKDQLSIDVKTVSRHKWKLGKWVRAGMYNERTDICIVCGCKRHMIHFYSRNMRSPVTEPSSYERSGVSFPSKPAPECWGAKNPE